MHILLMQTELFIAKLGNIFIKYLLWINVFLIQYLDICLNNTLQIILHANVALKYQHFPPLNSYFQINFLCVIYLLQMNKWYSWSLVLSRLINRLGVSPQVLVISASNVQAHEWISMLSQYFWHQHRDKRNTGNQGKVTQNFKIRSHCIYIGWYVLIPLTVILYVGFDLSALFFL